ncbi:MAG: hypothetical protein QM796_02900 [Chthoniobacteraceae bacterium]
MKTLRGSGIALLLLAVAYLLQACGPLRLDTDSLIFLSTGAQAADSAQGFPLASGKVFPPVYATLIALLDRAHLAGPLAFVLLNGAFIALGLVFTMKWWREEFAFSASDCRWMACLTLLSFPLIKHALLPQSDVAFFGMVMLVLWLLIRAWQAEPRWRWLVAALLVLALAMATRTAAVALVPAWIWTAWPRRWPRWWLLAGAAVVPVVGLAALSTTRYFHEASGQYSALGVSGVLLIAMNHVAELGQLLVNLPLERLKPVLQPLVYLAGVVLLIGVALVLWWRRRQFGPIEVFLLCYGLLIFIWPYRDVRFWLPAIPVLLAMVGYLFRQAPPAAAWLVGAGYSLAGLLALGFATWLTFSGAQFPNRYGDGTLRAAYQAVWTGTPLPAGGNEMAYIILKRYGHY